LESRREPSGVTGAAVIGGTMRTAVRWSRVLSLSLVLGATSFIPTPMVWASVSSEPCAEGQERDKSGRCVSPCPRGQFRHPAGYCTCGVGIADPKATLTSCAEAIQGQ
jgi:hypothetical protein